jgi:hypothetical protein
VRRKKQLIGKKRKKKRKKGIEKSVAGLDKERRQKKKSKHALGFFGVFFFNCGLSNFALQYSSLFHQFEELFVVALLEEILANPLFSFRKNLGVHWLGTLEPILDEDGSFQRNELVEIGELGLQIEGLDKVLFSLFPKFVLGEG